MRQDRCGWIRLAAAVAAVLLSVTGIYAEEEPPPSGEEYFELLDQRREAAIAAAEEEARAEGIPWTRDESMRVGGRMEGTGGGDPFLDGPGVMPSLPRQEYILNQGIQPVGDTDIVPRVLRLPEGRLCVLHLEGLELIANVSSDGGRTFAPEVVVAGEPLTGEVWRFWAAASDEGWIHIAFLAVNAEAGYDLLYTGSPDGGETWTEARELDGPEQPYRDPHMMYYKGLVDIDTGPGGAVAVVYVSDRDQTIRATVSADHGSTWSPPTRLDHPVIETYLEAGAVDLVFDRNSGALHVAFGQGRYLPWLWNAGYSIFTSTSTDLGETFLPEVPIDETWEMPYAINPEIEVAPDGSILVATYGDYFYWSYGYFVYRSTDGGQSYGRVFDEGWYPTWRWFDIAFPQLTVVPESGAVLFTYFTPPSFNGDLVVHRSLDNGASFGPAEILTGGTVMTRWNDEFETIRGPEGTVAVVWKDRRGFNAGRGADLYARVSDDAGANWGPEVRFNSDEAFYQAFALLASFDATMVGGELYSAWVDTRGSGFQYDIRGAGIDPATLAPAAPEQAVGDDDATAEAPVLDLATGSDGESRYYAAMKVTGDDEPVWIRSSADGGRTFLDPVRVPAADGREGRVLLYGIEATPDGSVYLVYGFDPADAYRTTEIRVNRSVDFGATWMAEGVLVEEEDNDVFEVLTASEPGGRLYLMWRDTYEGELLFARSADGGANFHTRDLVEADTARAYSPTLDVRDGTIFVAWDGAYRVGWSFEHYLLVRTSDNGGETFTAATTIKDDQFYLPVIAGGPGGTAVAAWLERDASYKYSVLTRRYDGTAWQPEVTVPCPTNLSSGLPVVHFGGAGGNQVFVMTEKSHAPYPADFAVHLARSIDGGATFPTCTRLDGDVPDPTAFEYSWKLTGDGEGNLWAAWMEYDPGPGAIVAVKRSIDSGATWDPVRRTDHAEPPGIHGACVLQAHALPGVGLFAWESKRDLLFYDALFNADSVNAPPVADAGEDQVLECEGDLEATALLDGSGSHDPDSTPEQCDIANWAWTEEGETVAEGETASAAFELGAHVVVLTVTDRAGATGTDDLSITVEDSLPPEGGITFPEEGACFGAVPGEVEVLHDFLDICDPEPEIVYEPGPGPVYTEHGDYTVTVSAGDRTGNRSEESVSFHLDLAAPEVEYIHPDHPSLVIPGELPLAGLYTAHDEDGVSGGIVYEIGLLDGCPVWDGRTYGDGDGLLSDEILPLDYASLCNILRMCGFEFLDRPVLRLEAFDCGGNAGFDEVALGGSFLPAEGVCP